MSARDAVHLAVMEQHGIDQHLRSGFGTAFEIHKNGKFTLLHDFTGGTDGKYLYGGLILDTKGRIYGTTINGGTGGYGTVWRITK